MEKKECGLEMLMKDAEGKNGVGNVNEGWRRKEWCLGRLVKKELCLEKDGF